MSNSQDHNNPWQVPRNKEALESVITEVFSSYEQVILDLGRAYPGDLTSETFLESQIEGAKWILQTIESASKVNERVPIKVRFSEGRSKDLFNKSYPTSWELWENGTTLSFYYERNRTKKVKVLSLFDLLSLIQEGRLCKESLGSGKGQLILPLCLWGDVEQIGHHYADYDQNFAEVFEFVGSAGPRPSVVFVNGPLGQAYLWQDLKAMKLRDIGMPVRTLHFFKDKSAQGLLKVWNEFFREDSCHKCLPCGFSRQGMKEDKNVDTLKGLAAFQCHYPMLYRKVDSFLKILEEPQVRNVGGIA